MTTPPPATRSLRFDGMVALITGASDRGIGGAIAERMAREGAGLALLSRRRPERLLKKLERLGAEARWTVCDLRDRSSVEAAMEAVAIRFPQIRILVNNAGIEAASPVGEMAQDKVDDLIETNLSGTIRMIRAALPRLQTPGCIVNVASALGLAGCPGFSVYSATKAGVIGLTQSLAWELAPRRIRVVAVAPGLVHTPMIHRHIEHLTPAVRAQIESSHPLGMGMPHDVAAAVAFLASDDAHWITGVTLPLGWAPQYLLPVDPFM